MVKSRCFPHFMLIVALGMWLAACAPPNVDLTGQAADIDGMLTKQGAAADETESPVADTITLEEADQVGGPGGPPTFEHTAQPAEGDQAAEQAPGEIGGTQADIDAGQDTEEMPPDSMINLDVSTWSVYTNVVYGFIVRYPPVFVVKETGGGDTLFGATAIDTVHFVDTQNEMADIAPPPFAVRIFNSQEGQSLAAWLEDNGLIGAEANVETEPFSTEHIDGIRVISHNLMAPGWSVFVLHGSHVFQLVPLGEEGELMLETFTFL